MQHTCSSASTMALHLLIRSVVVSLISCTAAWAFRCLGTMELRRGTFQRGRISVLRDSVSFRAVYTACASSAIRLGLQRNLVMQMCTQPSNSLCMAIDSNHSCISFNRLASKNQCRSCLREFEWLSYNFWAVWLLVCMIKSCSLMVWLPTDVVFHGFLTERSKTLAQSWKDRHFLWCFALLVQKSKFCAWFAT